MALHASLRIVRVKPTGTPIMQLLPQSSNKLEALSETAEWTSERLQRFVNEAEFGQVIVVSCRRCERCESDLAFMHD